MSNRAPLDITIDSIIDHWEAWDGEASQDEQREQHPDAYRETMRTKLKQAIQPLSFEVGDLVEAIPPYHLACGSGVYSRAVLVSLNPFVAVSETGDMLWRATISPEKVKRIGKALPNVLAVAMKRWNS